MLRRWVEARPGGAFVFTSNVDHQFHRARFTDETVLECHGSIEWWQCAGNCGQPIWRVPEEVAFTVDEAACRAAGALPRCPRCDGIARMRIVDSCAPIGAVDRVGKCFCFL